MEPNQVTDFLRFKTTHYKYFVDFDTLNNNYSEKKDFLGKSKSDAYSIGKFFRVLDSISFPSNMDEELINDIQKDIFPIVLFVLLQCVDKESFFIDVTQNFLPKQGTTLFRKMGVVLLKATVNSIVKNWKMFKLLFTTLTVDRALRVDVLYYLMSTPTYLTALRNSISNSSNFSTTLYVIMFVGLIFPQRQFTNGQQFVAKLWLNKNNNEVPSYYYENFPFDCFQGSLAVLDYFETIRSDKWIESFINLYEIKFLLVPDDNNNDINPKNKRIFIQIELDNILIWIFENSASSFTLRRHSHIKFLEPLEIEMKVINQLDVIENKSLCKITGKFYTDMEIIKLERLFLTENEDNLEVLRKNSTFQINIALKENKKLGSFLKAFQVFESKGVDENGNNIYNPDKENFYEDSYVYTLNDPIDLDKANNFPLELVAEDSTNEPSFLQGSTSHSEISENIIESTVIETCIKKHDKIAVESVPKEPKTAALVTPSKPKDVSSSIDINSGNSSRVTTALNISNSKLITDSNLAKKLNKFQSFVREKFKESKLQNKTAQTGIWDIESTQKGQNKESAEQKITAFHSSTPDGKNKSENNILSKLRRAADYDAMDSMSNSNVTYSKSKEISRITANDTLMLKIVNESATASDVLSSPLEKSVKLRNINKENAGNSNLLDDLSGELIAQRVSRKKVVYKKQETSAKRKIEKEASDDQLKSDSRDCKKRKNQKLTDSSEVHSSLQPENSPLVRRLRPREKPKEKNATEPILKSTKVSKNSRKKTCQVEKKAISKPNNNFETSITKENPRTSSNDTSVLTTADRTVSELSTKEISSLSAIENTKVSGIIMNPLNLQNQVFQNLNFLSQSLVRKISIMNEEMQRKADEITKEMQIQIEAARKEHEKKLETFHKFIEQMSNVAFQENNKLEEWINGNK